MAKIKAKKTKAKKIRAKTISLSTPFTEEDLKDLRAGDKVLISGKIFCARDSAHRLFGDHPPFDPKGAVIYYASPTPARKNSIIGSIGPTTATRMDPFTPGLLKIGIKATIGKGVRGPEVIEAIKKYKAVYLIVPGGTAAALSRHVRKSTIIAYPELGPEAVLEIEVINFPAIVAIDYKGGDLFEEGKKKYQRN
jgi:fumarate hydratase subunit beta